MIMLRIWSSRPTTGHTKSPQKFPLEGITSIPKEVNTPGQLFSLFYLMFVIIKKVRGRNKGKVDTLSKKRNLFQTSLKQRKLYDMKSRHCMSVYQTFPTCLYSVYVK